MNRTKKMSLLLGALTFAAAAVAQQADHGTADQAKAMLIRAVAAVKADKAKAIEEFNAGADGFRDRDLYVFCANVDDGKVVAQGNPNAKQQLGQDNRTFKDSTGKPFGKRALCRREETRRADYRGQLPFHEAGRRRQDTGTEDNVRDARSRSDLRRGVLQIRVAQSPLPVIPRPAAFAYPHWMDEQAGRSATFARCACSLTSRRWAIVSGCSRCE